MASEPGDLERQARIREARQRIEQHPGYLAFAELNAFNQTLTSVFIPNWRELQSLLEQAATNFELAVELIQNAHRPDVREQFQSKTIQKLHNYGAATMTLVDHARRPMRERKGNLATEYERRKQELLANPEIPFVQDLRNFMLHRTLPGLEYTLSISDPNSPNQTMISEVQLNCAQLLEWDRWAPTSRAFLEAQAPSLHLRPVVNKHGRLVAGLNSWLVGELAKANAPSLEETNELVVEYNAALAGADTETARRFTDEWTARRNSPGPILRPPVEPPTPPTDIDSLS